MKYCKLYCNYYYICKRKKERSFKFKIKFTLTMRRMFKIFPIICDYHCGYRLHNQILTRSSIDPLLEVKRRGRRGRPVHHSRYKM